MYSENKSWGIILVLCVLGVFGLVGFSMYFIPKYNVWTAEQNGRARLAESEYARQTIVMQAQAELEAAQKIKETADILKDSLTPEMIEYLKVSAVRETNPSQLSVVMGLDKTAVVTPQKSQ